MDEVLNEYSKSKLIKYLPEKGKRIEKRELELEIRVQGLTGNIVKMCIENN